MRSYFEKLFNPSQTHKQLPFIFPLLIALISGAIFSFALAPYYFWWLAILSPALLYAVLRQRNPRQAFVLGWAYGFGLWFVGAFWLYTSIHTYGDTNAFLSILMIAFMAAAMGLFTAFQHGCTVAFSQKHHSPLHHSGSYLNGQKPGYLQVSHGCLLDTHLLNGYWMAMHLYLVSMPFLSL